MSDAAGVSRGLVIRAARIDEAEALTALCTRSKRHWGYDDTFMKRSAISLRVRAGAIANGRVFVAGPADEPARALGIAELTPMTDGVIELDKLFVDPPAIGRGVGARLLRHVLGAARDRGARRMTVLADPNAAAFYERLGARFLRMAPSDAIPGRELPFYEFDMTAPQRPAVMATSA
jgi:GNAT superfamily N-acetyltransferase